MDTLPKLIGAMRRSIEHLSLLGVLVLEFAALFLLSFLFSLGGFALQEMKAALVALMVAQLLAMLATDAFFKAGFSRMARDVVSEKATGLRRFLPGARTYWARFLGYLLLRAAICVALLLPFLALSALSPTQGWSAAQLTLFGLALVLIFAVALFWLLWTGAILVFEDVGPIAAMGRSARLAHSRTAHTLRAMLVCMCILLAALLLGLLVNLPYQAAAFSQGPSAMLEPSAGILVLGAAVDIVTSVIFAYALVVLTLFVFSMYEETPKAGDAVQKKPSRKR